MIQVHRENVLFALRVAINDQRKREADHGFTRDSALVAGWEELYKAIQQGESVTFFATS